MSMFFNCHTCFSLRYGVLTVDQLLDEAGEKGHSCLGITDINNTSAPLEFVMKARKRGIRPVVGIEFRDQQLRYIGIARNEEGFRHLNEFLSTYLHSAALGTRPNLAIGKSPGGSFHHPPVTGPGPARVLSAPDRALRFPERAPRLPHVYFIYPFSAPPKPDELREDEFVGVRPDELNRLFSSPLRAVPGKLVALLPVTFSSKVEYNTHRLLRAIDKNIILSKQSKADLASLDEVMRTPAEVAATYQDHSYMVTNTQRLMEQCAFEMPLGTPKNKQFFTASINDDLELLTKLAWEGFRSRYGESNREAKARVQKELQVIHRMGFSAYFLITWDFIKYGKSRGFFHVGRGSGANSIVAYCIGITDVDPIELDLYFERFLNPHRTSPPDFDIDFSWTDRDEVIDYVFKRYGHRHTSLIATYSTFKGRSVLRELGKVYGLPKHEIDDLVEGRHNPVLDNPIVRQIFRYGERMQGLPNLLGIHAGGILITEKPIRSYAATDLPPKGFPIVQFDMFVTEDAGIHKFDVLSQRGLGHIRSSAEVVKSNHRRTIDVHEVDAFKRDPRIAELISTGDTIGCFYVESPAMRQLLRKLQCDNYLSLVAASSVIRPGVAKSGMMRQFIERHRVTHGLADGMSSSREGWYLHPKMGEILAETYGVMVYQEDVIKVAHYFGGVDLGEADVLRRAMSGKYRSRNQFELIREKFHANCRELGYNEAVVDEVWRQMESFAGYSFCKAHSASFAVESYQSLFFKAHYPIEFMVGVINNFGGFYSNEVYLHEAKRAGAIVHAPCVNHSEYLTSLEGKEIWLGLIHLKGLEKRIAEDLVRNRKLYGPYRHLDDLLRRTRITHESVTILIRIGALRFTGLSKKHLLWMAIFHFGKKPVRQQVALLFEPEQTEWQLPDLPDHPVEDLYDELELLGFPLGKVDQSVKGIRPPIFELLSDCPGPDEVTAASLDRMNGRRVVITGYLISTKPVQTVKGDIMAMCNFIDVAGDYFDAVLFPDVYRQSRLYGLGVYRMAGKIVNDFGVSTLEVERVERLGYVGDPRRE